MKLVDKIDGMLLFGTGGKIMASTISRSFVKAITYRLFSSIGTFIVAWSVTGSIRTGGLISVIEGVVKIGYYFGHERLWKKIPWGKIKNETINID